MTPLLFFKSRYSVRINRLARHMGYHVNTLNRTIDLARETPYAILLVRSKGLLFGLIPAHHIYETRLDTCFAARACFLVDLDLRTHVTSIDFIRLA
jgi:hypothetical protein